MKFIQQDFAPNLYWSRKQKKKKVILSVPFVFLFIFVNFSSKDGLYFRRTVNTRGENKRDNILDDVIEKRRRRKKKTTVFVCYVYSTT